MTRKELFNCLRLYNEEIQFLRDKIEEYKEEAEIYKILCWGMLFVWLLNFIMLIQELYMFKNFKVTKENLKDAELLLKIFEFFNSLGYKKQKEIICKLKLDITKVKKEKKK